MEQQKNKYEVLILPVNYHKEFLTFSQAETQKYYQWFLNIRNNRLTHLCSFLFSNNEDCLNEKNLNVIEMFLMNSVSIIPKPLEQFHTEQEKIPPHLKPFAKPDDYLFDKRTISVCYDIGIFLGELIIKLDNKINWELESDDKYVDYGQPVLKKGKIKFDVNPFSVAKNMAAKVYKGTYSEKQISTAFTVWKKAFKVGE